jgi:hypothetical protein
MMVEKTAAMTVEMKVAKWVVWVVRRVGMKAEKLVDMMVDMKAER